ncbi:DUF763 domain-containing protein [Methanomassiliicoccus luminyensis]|uniref:DUF763 domain-containing protein n=1 Tax=Methanomassiliicoccus luminyensis TaxID=1080712 RepID=UPI000364D135|nr:DUF763 domain-containing protein [Methanomassiliicoccus luminyensis]
MARTGITDLPLHNGTAPRWLFNQMVKLAGAITDVMVLERGSEEYLRRLADPFWFQAFSCVLGFDWHSSGTTTVTCGALKKAFEGRKDLAVVGGKGKVSLRTPEEIAEVAELNDISEEFERQLVYISRMCAKVDNAAIQSGHRLYHHALLFDREGHWTVVQQGMSDATGYARRYQWCSSELRHFVEEPHTAILGSRVEEALDMTASSSEGSRKLAVDLVNDGIDHLRNDIVVVEKGQTTLDEWCGLRPKKLHMPRTVNWRALRAAYEFQPQDYEELLAIRGVGPSAVRALALAGELVYGEEPSWRDPVKYTFAVGGKDGVPFPVDRRAMDEAVRYLEMGVEEAKLKKREKLEAMQRLRAMVPPDA